MRSYKNNHKRKFRINGDRNSSRNHNTQTLISNTSFQRKNHRNNNHNAARLIEKYSSLAREALSNGDKILSENYLQHSEHFSRILISQENTRNHSENNTQNNELSKVKVETENNVEIDNKEVEELRTK